MRYCAAIRVCPFWISACSVHDEGGLEFKGITEQPDVGYLTQLEALRYTEVRSLPSLQQTGCQALSFMRVFAHCLGLVCGRLPSWL